MKYLIPLLLICTLFSFAEEKRGQLIFQDDFERSETDDSKEQPGNDWKTNSKSRAKGHKQVDLRDGAMYIYTHAEADHAAVAMHDFAFQNGTISMRVKFENVKDSLNINIADPSEKSVHAGHLFNIEVRPTSLGLTDLKTGRMKLEIRAANKSKTLSPEQKKLIAAKTKKFKNKLDLNEWYLVEANINGDVISYSLNGKEIGSFKSPGFAHPTKKKLRLIVNKNVYVDDIKIWKK